VKFDNGVFYENLSMNSMFDCSGATISGILHKDQSTFVYITVRNILWLDNVANGPCFFDSVADLSGFILMTAISKPKYKGDALLRFYVNSSYANAPQSYVVRTLLILFLTTSEMGTSFNRRFVLCSVFETALTRDIILV
jgi:hypothetical protein